MDIPGGAVVKNPLASAEDTRDTGSVPEVGRSREKGMATHSWRIPWSERSGGL